MPSLDIVNEIDNQEVDNAVNNTTKEITTRYDFRGLKEGIDRETAKKIVKEIKETKLKVQPQIQDDQVRVTGKKIDDLQAVMAHLKGKDMGVPLQFTNMK